MTDVCSLAGSVVLLSSMLLVLYSWSCPSGCGGGCSMAWAVLALSSSLVLVLVLAGTGAGREGDPGASSP